MYMVGQGRKTIVGQKFDAAPQGDVDSVNDSCQAFETNRNKGKKKVKIQDKKLGRQDFDAHSEMNVREIQNRQGRKSMPNKR